MIDFGAVMKIKQSWNRFLMNHPKLGPFLNGVKSKGFTEGQEIAIAIRYPDGTEFKTGIRVTQEDLGFLETAKNIANSAM